MTETRQQIKDRLFRHAGVLWGLPETPAEANFDPLVGLLLGACATELEKISTDIEESRSRILERLVKLLFPEVLTAGIPAHAIAHAQPMENRFLLPAKTAFFVSSANGAGPDVYFTPVADTILCKASVSCMATPHAFYKTENGLSRHFLQTIANRPEIRQKNYVWLGIEGGKHLSPGACFYFELKNEAGKEQFYEQLDQCRFFIDGKLQAAEVGYGDTIDNVQSVHPADIVEGNHSATRQIVGSVRAYYRRQFVQVSFEGIAEGKLPDFIKQMRVPTLDSKEVETLTWLQIEFPGTIPISWLEDITISLNCFPLINRKLYSLQHRLLQYVNIVPLYSDSYFFDLESVTNEEGNSISQTLQGRETVSAHLRYGGTGRFSGKEAVVAIENLIQQIKDESSAYAVIGNDFLSGELNVLQQTLNKLDEQLVNKQLTKGNSPHLVFTNKAPQSPQTVFMEYWGTQGVLANHIKAGTQLSTYKNVELSSNRLQLVSATTNGRDPLNESEKVLAYKAALLSKEKLVTREDIISFCRMRLAISEATVIIENGYLVNKHQSQGFSKTIDIKIKLTQREIEQLRLRGELEALGKELKEAVVVRSNFFMPVRVFIN